MSICELCSTEYPDQEPRCPQPGCGQPNPGAHAPGDVTCPACNRTYSSTSKACPACFTRNPVFATPTNTAAPGHHGWRVTLPNHQRLLLTERYLVIGRSTPGPIGDVLSLFNTVSRRHLDVVISNDKDRVDIKTKTGAGPTFQFELDTLTGGPAEPEPALMEPGTPYSIARPQGIILCLGQCCFIKIDVGEV